MRKAIVSVTNNIAEGHGRWHYQENIQFCRISRGSVEEILDDINVCLDEGYGKKGYNEELKATGYALIAKINGYIAYLRKCKQGALAILSIGLMLPSAPGFVGTFQFFIVAGLSLFAVTESLALSFSIALHAAFFISETAVGLICLWRANLSLPKMVQKGTQKQ